MNLRTKIILYLVLLHVALGVVAVLVLAENRTWLFVVEGLFLLSVIIGWMLVRAFFVPLDLIRTGADLMREREFATRFREVGQPEMDALINVYNEMIDKLRDERLRVEEQQQFLAKIAEASPAGIVTTDLDGAIATINPAAKRLLAGATLPEVPIGDSHTVSLPGGRTIRIQHGEYFDRGFARSFYLIDELTEELRATEKAAYEQLIRMMSHEVNNSVGAVRSLLESSLNYAGQLRESDRADFENALQVAIGRMDRLNAFVNGFAEVVRLPAPHLGACRLDELMRDIMTLAGPELESRGIEVHMYTEGEIAAVRADKNQMEQALLNVVKNAAEAIGRDGSIEIALRQNGASQLLTIADSGPGIPPEAAARLFTPFFSTKRDGRGLGLTLIREVLDQHHFRYSLHNRPQGGAEFRIEFS